MNPHYDGINPNASEKAEYLLFAKEKYSHSIMLTIMKFKAKSKPFHEFLFNSTIVNEIESTERWKSQIIGNNNESVFGMTQ